MVCLQVVNLLLEELRPKILADELDGLEMIREPRPLHGIPFRELVTDLISNGLDPACGEFRLVGIESIAIARHHLRQQAINATL